VTLYDELASETLVRYENPGRLEVCRSQRAFQTACAEAELIGSFGFSSRRLSGAEVKQFEPAVQGKVAGAIYYPDSGFCDPLRFVLRLANAAQGLGAEVRTNTPVTDLRIENGRVVSVVAVGEEIDADAVVLACGSWTPQLTQRLGLRLPVQPGKGYHVDLGLPVLGPRMPIVLLEERIFATPLEGVLRLAGTMEFSGFHLHLRPARLKMLTQGAARYFPHMEHACIRSRWCHLRPMTPDGLPIIGPAPLARNVWIATGHGMLGLTQGPATGKLVAEWIIEGHPGLDLTPLRPERFQRSNRSAFTSAAAARASWLPAHRSGAAYLFRPRRPPGNE
jgi:D-amino-acid dehydrogenase